MAARSIDALLRQRADLIREIIAALADIKRRIAAREAKVPPGEQRRRLLRVVKGGRP